MVLIDRRIGNSPRYYSKSEYKLRMKIPEDIHKCIAFLEFKDAKGYHLDGTVFFVTMSSVAWPNYFFRYAVTAGHCIKNIGKEDIYLRLNKSDHSDVLHYLTKKDEWCFHTDPSVDIAVTPVDLGDAADCLYWAVKDFATDEVIEETGIGAGNDVFLTGLFREHPGTQGNIPIIRAGIISAMPEELVQGALPDPMEAYLIEARSVNGLSGSPVFVHPELGYAHSLETEDPLAIGRDGGMARSFWLLGLMHGHYGVKTSQIDTSVEGKELIKRIERINAGIGIVVPARKILEVIEQPRFEEMRKEEEMKLKKEGGAVMDYLIEEPTKEKPFTKEDFEDALKRASDPDN